jgi:long-chain acyl-CoA synthetase
VTASTIPAHFAAALERFAAKPVLEDKDGVVTMGEMLAQAAAVAEGLRRRGVRPGDRVGMLADNSRRWIAADLAVQVAGAVNVPRGTDTPDAEAVELFAHAGATFAFAHDARAAARLERLRERLPDLREVAALDPAGYAGLTFDRLAEEGRDNPGFPALAARVSPDDVATIIYTSGTTGRPKGVVLTQANFAHQVEVIPTALGIGPTDSFLSVLPPWHVFERTVEYVCLTQGARLVYTDRRRFKDDLATRGATFVPSVPRLWETVYDGVRKALAEGSPVRRALFSLAYGVAGLRAAAWDRARAHVVRTRRPRGLAVLSDLAARAVAGLAAFLLLPLDAALRRVVFSRLRKLTGGSLRGAVVGGGLMPAHVDRFFRTVGVGVLVGYGLTETSPVLTVRRERRNVLGTIGTTIPGVEIQVRDPATRRPLPPGEVGVVWTRGPQVMRGYHRDEEATARVIDADGWFDTGDLGVLTEEGDLCFRGRAKETIVLSGGENVEPSRVEEAIAPSPLVEQVVVVGQDRKTLAALVWPRADEVRRRLGLPAETAPSEVAARPEAQALLLQEVRDRTGPGRGLRPFEAVTRVALLPEPLSADNGCMTATLKPKRHEIARRFADRIEGAYR